MHDECVDWAKKWNFCVCDMTFDESSKVEHPTATAKYVQMNHNSIIGTHAHSHNHQPSSRRHLRITTKNCMTLQSFVLSLRILFFGFFFGQFYELLSTATYGSDKNWFSVVRDLHFYLVEFVCFERTWQTPTMKSIFSLTLTEPCFVWAMSYDTLEHTHTTL